MQVNIPYLDVMGLYCPWYSFISYHKRKLVNHKVTLPFNKNVTTKKLCRKPSKPTAQTKELRDKEGKRALDHAGKDVFFGCCVVVFCLGVAFCADVSCFFGELLG